MKHKTADLEGNLLDAAVAKAEGHEYSIAREPDALGGNVWIFLDRWPGKAPWSPSRSWQHAGPIIERERIKVQPEDEYWLAAIFNPPGGYAEGPTALIAAMRAFVASKLGEEVELP